MDDVQANETMAPDRADERPETEAAQQQDETTAAESATPESGDDQQQQSNAGESVEADEAMQAHDPLARVPRPDGADTSSTADSAAAAETAHQDGHPAPPQVTPEALGRLREAFVALNPEVVPELIAGETIEAVLESLDAAKAAYARVKGEVEARVAGAVPRGGSSRTVDPAVLDGLSPAAKIAYGLSQQQA